MIDWSKSHNGVMLCSFEKTYELMPGEWPCIPNWHCDFVPRDLNLKRLPEKVTPGVKMYFWISGAPFTEFKRGNESYLVEPKKWIEFDQRDLHFLHHGDKPS